MWKPFRMLCMLSFLKLSIFPLPAGLGTSPDDALILAPDDVLRFDSSDAGLRLESAWNGGVMRPVSGDVSVPPSGNHVLSVLARDAVGNASQVSWLWIRVDPKPPEVALAIDPPAATTADGTAYVRKGTSVRISASDQLAGLAALHVSTNGETKVLNDAKATLDLPDEGRVRLKVWGVDAVGNQSRAIEMELYVDGDPPSGKAQVIGDFIYPDYPDRRWRVASPVIHAEVDVVDEESGPGGWRWRINGQMVDPEQQPERWPGGDYSVAVVARDRAGNEAVLTSLDFTVDDTPPSLKLELSQDGQSVTGDDEPCVSESVQIVPRVEDDLSGLFALYRLGGNGIWQEIQPGAVIVGQNVDLLAVDWVGNQTRLESGLAIDRDPPAVGVETEAGLISVSGFEVNLTLPSSLSTRVDDAGCGVAESQYRLDDGSWQALNGSVTFAKPGRYQLHIRAVDRLGHATDLTGTVIVTAEAGGGQQ